LPEGLPLLSVRFVSSCRMDGQFSLFFLLIAANGWMCAVRALSPHRRTSVVSGIFLFYFFEELGFIY